ncbi:C-glycoside deglycosidase beta subunit domain-containing protein [Croceicoccus marinus]|uniref:C-deglycosylation enzyme beta subunit n=1 Tax=Croceicoccus marinus TaxID=450378 RepID=A0A1Z1FHD6_9SPHN|nr:DUF6379 domain-containing protein [Croceicoccus marinus]ARU18175.1 hypothetical protein A9D14_16725 [Croceicoccus marinus]QNE07464.1 hypothetical protein H4O24_16435 [Croceicoccus marinus]
MLEHTPIQSSGFSNIGPEDQRTGFCLRVRQPNYRGLRLSLVEGIRVVVDGHEFPAASNRYRMAGRTYSLQELDAETQVRWPVGTAMEVLVDKPGGLAAGVHLVEVEVLLRHPYFPPQFRPTPVHDRRHITIIR